MIIGDKLFENTPYNSDRDLIEAYNSFMELLPDDGWTLFRDADTLFLDSYYGKHILKAIEMYPETGCFTCLTNRIGARKQLHNEYKGDDITIHRQIATNLRNLNGDSYVAFGPAVKKVNVFSGMMFVLSKKVWKDIGGFKEFKPGHGRMLGVDNRLHLDLDAKGYDVKILTGMYIYHWYRGGNAGDIKHLRP